MNAIYDYPLPESTKYTSGLDRQFILKDGRTLAYTEHGDLSGEPVFLMHGNPSCRFMRHPDESIAKNLGIRIITPDRPGYGLSDFKSDRTVLDFPDDVIELADHLNIKMFSIFGISAGGPYTAAMAYKYSNRIKNIAIISAPAPFDADHSIAYEKMNKTWRWSFKLSKYIPKNMLLIIAWLQNQLALQNPSDAIDKLASTLSRGDQEIMQRPAIRESMVAHRPEATRNGVKGIIHEAKLLVSNWGFPIEDILKPVHLWYWEDDLAIPIQMGHYLQSKIPNTNFHQLPAGGHMAFFDHWAEILQCLLETSQTEDA